MIFILSSPLSTFCLCNVYNQGPSGGNIVSKTEFCFTKNLHYLIIKLFFFINSHVNWMGRKFKLISHHVCISTIERINDHYTILELYCTWLSHIIWMLIMPKSLSSSSDGLRNPSLVFVQSVLPESPYSFVPACFLSLTRTDIGTWGLFSLLALLKRLTHY